MMFQVPFLCIAASCLLDHTIAERPVATEGGVSVRATGGFQTAKRHIPESQVEPSSLSETAEVAKSSPSKTAESTVDVQVDKSSLSETAESALGMQQIIRQQLSIMQQQLDILNLEKAKRDAAAAGPLPGENGHPETESGLGASTGYKIKDGDRSKFTEVDPATTQKRLDELTQLKDTNSKHKPGDLASPAQSYDKDSGALTPKELEVSDKYEDLRKEMRGKEELIFAKTFDTRAYNDKGSLSYDANKAYHEKLANYVQKLFMMSRGAHQVTAKEFNEHLKMASDLSKAVHSGYEDIAVGPTKTFASELNEAKGHVSVEGRQKMLKYTNEVVKPPGGDVEWDRAHLPGLNHGTADDRANHAANGIADREHTGGR